MPEHTRGILVVTPRYVEVQAAEGMKRLPFVCELLEFIGNRLREHKLYAERVPHLVISIAGDSSGVIHLKDFIQPYGIDDFLTVLKRELKDLSNDPGVKRYVRLLNSERFIDALARRPFHLVIKPSKPQENLIENDFKRYSLSPANTHVDSGVFGVLKAEIQAYLAKKFGAEEDSINASRRSSAHKELKFTVHVEGEPPY
jgi:hypothetical protein